MSNITIYLDDALEQRLRQAAAHEGVSVSKLVSKLVLERTAVTWPDEVLGLAGSWKNDQLTLPTHGPDSPRETW